MRELKFRVWSEEDKQYRTDCDAFRLFHGKTGCPATIYNDEGDRFDIEQYTGLKDKNGKEIYEGDILEYTTCYYGNEKRHRKVVEWKEWDSDDFGEPHNLGYFDLSEYMGVIGNIHENGDLLNEEESEPNLIDITNDKEFMERVLKKSAEMQEETLKKAGEEKE